MTLARTTDATFLNQVANHPDVRPWLGTDGESFVDVGVLLNLPGAFALTNEWGGFVFMLTGDGAYEFHTMFLPEGRGRRALRASLEACDLMFGAYGAPTLQTYVPHGNIAAKWLVKVVGFSGMHADAEQSYWRFTKAEWEARAPRAAA